MATTSDTHRTAIRERKRHAQHALRERHQRQEAAQTAAFSALDRLARQLDQATTQLANSDTDPLERADAITAIAHQLAADITAVRATAADLATTTAMSQTEVADLLGTRQALLFPRTRPTARHTNQPTNDTVDLGPTATGATG